MELLIFQRRGRDTLRVLYILTSRGLMARGLFCSWTVSHQRAGISCLLFLETSFILPHLHMRCMVCRSANNRKQDSGRTQGTPPSASFDTCFLPGRLNYLISRAWRASLLYFPLLSPCELMLAMGDAFRFIAVEVDRGCGAGCSISGLFMLL